MTVVQQMRIKSMPVAMFVFDIGGQLVECTNENVSILHDTHRQMTSKRLKMDCLLANAGEMADGKPARGDTHPLPRCSPLRDPVWTQGGWGTGNVSLGSEVNGG